MAVRARDRTSDAVHIGGHWDDDLLRSGEHRNLYVAAAGRSRSVGEGETTTTQGEFSAPGSHDCGTA